MERVKDFALGTTSLEFRFLKRKALKNVRPRYTETVLEQVRTQLKGLSEEELLQGFSWPDGPLHRIYRDSSDWGAFRDAIAHVLLERCIAAGRGDRTCMLWVRQDRLTKFCS